MKKPIIATDRKFRELRVSNQKTRSRARVLTFDQIEPRRKAPEGSNGMEFVFGQWPGDETDEQIQAALKEIE